MMHFAEVKFEDWEADQGECENKCEGAAGPFTIVRKCKANEGFSCEGLKKKKKETKDCTKYCTSRAGKMKWFYIIQTNLSILLNSNSIWN